MLISKDILSSSIWLRLIDGLDTLDKMEKDSFRVRASGAYFQKTSTISFSSLWTMMSVRSTTGSSFSSS